MATWRGFYPGTCAASRNRSLGARILRRKLCRRADEARHRTCGLEFESGILMATRQQMGITQNDGDWRGPTYSSRIARRMYHRTLRGVCFSSQRLQCMPPGTAALEDLERE